MTDSVEEGLPTLPAPPGMPDGEAFTIAGVPGDTSPPERTGGAPRWLSEVALPFALGVVGAASWVGAAVLSGWNGLPFAELRAAQAALLLVAPTLIVVIVAALSRDGWHNADPAGSERGQRRAAINLSLALATIIVGLVPAFFAATPLPPDNNIGLLFFLPFAAPGFSLDVALDYAWGARPRPTGAGVGLMGGLGFAAPLVALAVILLVMSHQPPAGCDTAGGYGCELAQAVDQLVALLFLGACVFAITLSFIGGILGAYLRNRSSGAS